MASHSSILAWRIPWIEEPGGLQPIGSQKLDMNEATWHASTHMRLKVLDQVAGMFRFW